MVLMALPNFRLKVVAKQIKSNSNNANDNNIKNELLLVNIIFLTTAITGNTTVLHGTTDDGGVTSSDGDGGNINITASIHSFIAGCTHPFAYNKTQLFLQQLLRY